MHNNHAREKVNTFVVYVHYETPKHSLQTFDTEELSIQLHFDEVKQAPMLQSVLETKHISLWR